MGGIKRIWWQITGVLLFNFPFIERMTFSWLPVPVLNCYACPLAQGACPIGTIQHFFVIGMIPLFTLGFIGFFGMLAGRFFCGHLCPFGFLQDLLARITRRKRRIPRFLEYGKYAVLVVMVIILPPILKEPFFCTLCPAGSLEAGIPIVGGEWIKSHIGPPDPFGIDSGILGMIGWWFWFKLGILAAVVALAIVTRRPFCRTACPLGALLGLFNRVSLLVHPPGEMGAPGGQRYFLKNCPVHIVHPKDVDSPNCVKCRECYIHPAESSTGRE